jgi:hypothetical protein
MVSCVSQKLDKKAKAKDLYVSVLFKKNMSYAESLYPDAIYILSAKYGLLKLDDEREPYDLTLNAMKVAEKKSWAKTVLGQLKKVESLEDTKYVFLAGVNYRKYLLPSLKYYNIPMEGLPIGRQLQFLTEKLK